MRISPRGLVAFARRAALCALEISTVYGALLALLSIPFFQRELLYLHHVKLPVLAQFDNSERYGLAPFKTRNFHLDTPDGVCLGAWHILPRSVYRNGSSVPLEPFPPRRFEEALALRPTILYFHGNAATRAAPHRIRGYSSFSNTLDCNVIAIDYRGFADSCGTPSEAGLLMDARAAFDYVADSLTRSGVTTPEAEIILAGQSLGTGVVSGLAGQLAHEGIYPRALVMIAPFTSISELLLDYKLFRAIPLLSPLRLVPKLQSHLLTYLNDNFDSQTALKTTRSPTLILHAVNDDTIPHHHSKALFDSLSEHDEVSESTHSGWGRIIRTTNKHRPVVWWEGLAGGHNNLGWAEGTIDLIAEIAGL